jgi:hypothetical protein
MWTQDDYQEDFFSSYCREEWKSFYESSMCPSPLGGIA